MQNAVADPKVMEELLRQRGLLATHGRTRIIPVDDSGAVSSSSPAAANGSAVAAQLSGNGAPVPLVSGDPNNPTPEDIAKLENAPDSELIANWPLIVGAAGGSALALYLKHLLTKRGIPIPEAGGVPAVDPLAPIPTMEGTVEPTARIAGGNIQEGEFTDVTPRLEGQRALPAPGSGAAAHEEIVRALGGTTKPVAANTNTIEEGATPPKYLTARTLAERKAANAGKVSPATGRTMLAIDEYTDVAPDEMKQARAIAKQLIANRKAGIKEATKGKYNKPTLLDPETALQDVVRVLRETKALRALQGRH